MVGVARIELATPAMSTQCSTTELHAHSCQKAFIADRLTARLLGSGANSDAACDMQAPISTTVLTQGGRDLQNFVQLIHQLFQVEWLCQDWGLLKRIPRLKQGSGKARNEHHGHSGL